MSASDLSALFERLASLVWAYPVVGLCLLSAGYFTFRLRFVQLRGLPHAIALLRGRYDRPGERGEISHFQALSAALSGTVGRSIRTPARSGAVRCTRSGTASVLAGSRWRRSPPC